MCFAIRLWKNWREVTNTFIVIAFKKMFFLNKKLKNERFNNDNSEIVTYGNNNVYLSLDKTC